MSATITLTPQEELRRLAVEAQEIHAQGPLEGKNAVKMAELIKRMQDLRGHIEQGDALSDVVSFAGKSSGMLPLAGPNAGGAQLLGAPLAGGAQVAYSADTWDARLRNGGTGTYGKMRSMEIMEQYGEGIFGLKSMANTTTDEYRGAFNSYMRRGHAGLKTSELKTLQESVDTSGGFAVPHDILERVIAKEPTPIRVAGRITRLQTSRDSLIIPRINYTSDDLYTTGMRVTWTGEVPASSTAMRVTEPIFGQTHVPIYTAMMSIPITNDMIEDAAFPLVSYVTGKFGETIDLLFDNIVLNGTGQGQPSGILLNPGDSAKTQPATVAGTSSGALAADDILDIMYSLPEQYDTNAAWVMNKTNTLRNLAKLKDSDNHYLFVPGYNQLGFQAPTWRDKTLLGYDILLSGFMPDVGASTFPIIFGDLTGYYLVQRIGFSIQVLRELYAETNQILLLGRIRFGGQITEPWKLKVYQVHS